MKKILSVLMVLVLVLSACGGGRAKEDEDTFIRAGQTPESLDLALISYSQSFDIAADNYSGIYEVDADGKLVLNAADDFKISDDNLTYTFNLKQGTQWVDYEGNEKGEVTADDYMFAYERILTAETKAPMAYLLQGVIVGADDYLNGKITDFDKVGIKKIDDYTIEFKLNYVAPYFQGMLAFPTYYPQPKAAYEEYGDKYGTDAQYNWYNGAYYTTKYDAEYEVALTKNESYWDAANVKIPAIKFRTIEDDNTKKEAFSSDEIDYFFTTDENMYESGVNGIDAQDRLTGYSFFLALNTDSNRETSDPDLREALFYGFNRDEVNEGSSGKINKTIEYFMPEGITETTYDIEYRDYAEDSYVTYDIDRAEEALQRYMDKKGYSDPSEVELSYLINDSSGGKKTATTLQASYKQSLGITVTPEILPSQQYVEKRNEGGFDIANGGWGADYADPSTYFDIFTSPNIGSINTPRYDNQAYDTQATKAASIVDPEKRMEEYAKLEQMIMSDYAIVPFYQKNEPYFIDGFDMPQHLFLKISDKYTTPVAEKE